MPNSVGIVEQDKLQDKLLLNEIDFKKYTLLVTNMN